jgi:hypothetical protein
MIIESKLSERDLVNASFVLLYSKIYTKITTAIFSLFLFAAILVAIFRPVYSSFQELFIPVLLLIIRPATTYYTVRRNFSSNKRSGELIAYHFGEDYLSMKGESFTIELSWDKIYKVTQSKNWVFIWQNERFANVLPKRDIWEEQIDQLKEILQKHLVKNTL